VKTKQTIAVITKQSAQLTYIFIYNIPVTINHTL